ncbi:uncharacterized protein LOC123532692 [Mercenaria mercenaria]|uniref:uncharacterized protein LOC123532692 n=1 Tax=Mercenaria mercenaria TaxID=6596 RepID=UPI00234F5AA7|nr:uncharacterized protein LOC123532692 [Mercenaria mercenaria]
MDDYGLYSKPKDTEDQWQSESISTSKAGCGIQNNGFTIFKRVFSALLILGDVVIDWTSLADVIVGTISDESALAKNENFTFSFPAFKDAIQLFNSSATEKDKCGSSSFKITIWYSSFVLFGSVFALVKLLNIIGETRREICEKKEKGKSFGFQLLHGWTETLYALLFEDLPQNFLLLLYSMTCKHNALNRTKTYASMLGSFVKNVFRKSTCKQKPGCSFCRLYAFDIGCMNFTCLSFVFCSCCSAAQNYYPDGSLVEVKMKLADGNLMKVQKPIEKVKDPCMCCVCVELEWGYEVNIPVVCSCCRCIFIKQMGCFDNTFESKCCKPNYYGCCGKKIEKDPIYLEKYIILCYLINIVIFVMHILGTNLGDAFSL